MITLDVIFEISVVDKSISGSFKLILFAINSCQINGAKKKIKLHCKFEKMHIL